MNDLSQEPIARVVWRPASELKANAWNPNYVLDAELRLLERSILRTGWVQPILITPLDTIIDGFHRYKLSLDSTALAERYGGRVPCVVMQVTEAEAKILTVRMNRAKGVHAAFRMSALVHGLVVEDGMLPEQVAQELGMHKNEVELLLKEGVFEVKGTKDYRYSKAWVPAEDGKRQGALDGAAEVRE